jgi:preprotein translocase subunit SecF
MNKRFYAFMLSGLIIIAGVFLFVTKDFNLGIDFTGGTLIEVSYREDVSVNDLRKSLKTMGLGKSMIQRIGDENKFFVKIMQDIETAEEEAEPGEEKGFTTQLKEALMTPEERELNARKIDLNDISELRLVDFLVSKGIPEDSAKDNAAKLIAYTTREGMIKDFSELDTLDLKKRVISVLKEEMFLGRFIFLSTESVGPQVGHDLRGKVTRAAIYALLGMLIYIGVRFRFIFGIAAVITLIHDVLITLTAILLFNVEMSLHVVAAILTIVGYSLNDTIVIFDRVRDNLKLMRREKTEVILDRSINQTLSRTVVTSGTTLCVVLALFFFGGEVIHAFSFTLLVGVIVGTYSSIFQSCAWLRIWEKKLLGRKKT